MVWCHASAPAEAKSSSPRPSTPPSSPATLSRPVLAAARNCSSLCGCVRPFPRMRPQPRNPAFGVGRFPLFIACLGSACSGSGSVSACSSPGCGSSRQASACRKKFIAWSEGSATALAAFLAAHCLTWGASDASPSQPSTRPSSAERAASLRKE